MGLNIAFAGTPDLAAHILQSLVSDGTHPVSMVFTQPDRPSGRGKKINSSPVKTVADQFDLPVLQPFNKYELEHESVLKSLDVLIVAAYGLILTESVLTRPRLGCINIHMSLLPRWRGAAPVQHAILAGDNETGVTIMQMDQGLDTGDILLQKKCGITSNETAKSLQEKLAVLGYESVLETLGKLENDKIIPIPQNNELATYAKKIVKTDALIDWTKSADEIDRHIRAMNPSPVAYCDIDGKTIRVWEAEIIKTERLNRPPGTIINYSPNGLEIATGKNNINILRLQTPGKKVLATTDFYNGNPSMWNAREQG